MATEDGCLGDDDAGTPLWLLTGSWAADEARSRDSLEPMLRAIVGERRRLVLELDPGVGWIRIDPALLEQVVLNLVEGASRGG